MADWSLRKGCTYGTIVVDLERRRVTDLRPGRTRTTVADWLRQRPGTEVVARNRSTEYARAMRACPARLPPLPPSLTPAWRRRACLTTCSPLP